MAYATVGTPANPGYGSDIQTSSTNGNDDDSGTIPSG